MRGTLISQFAYQMIFTPKLNLTCCCHGTVEPARTVDRVEFVQNPAECDLEPWITLAPRDSLCDQAS